MTAGTKTVWRHMRWLCLAGLVALPLRMAHGANATDDHPLRPPDTSSPRATLQGFIDTTNDVYRRMTEVLNSYGKSDRLYPSADERREQSEALNEAMKLAQFLDLSGIAPVLKDTVAIERLLQLKKSSIASTSLPSRTFRIAAAMAAALEAMAVAEHRDRHRAGGQGRACRRISGVRRNDRASSGVLRAGRGPAVQAGAGTATGGRL